MRYFLFPLILGLIAVAALNVYMDTNSSWWRTHFNFSTQWDNAHVWVKPLRMDERKARSQHIPMLERVEWLGLGSSRFYTVNRSMLPTAPNFYNASVAGATMWDYVALWQQFKEQNNLPKHLIIYVDTWNFNQNTWQKYRWIPTLPFVRHFLAEGDYPGNTRVALTAWTDYLAGSFYEFSDLFSPAVLKVAVQEFSIYQQTNTIATNFIAPLRSRPADFAAWKNDGSHLYPLADLAPKPLAEINAIGRNTGLGAMSVYLKDWQRDDTAITLLDSLLADAEKHGVDVLLVQPPFQQETYKVLTTSPEYKAIPAHYDAIMQSLLHAHANARYCNALNPQTVGCAPTEFMDSAHTLPTCTQKILTYCLAKPRRTNPGK